MGSDWYVDREKLKYIHRYREGEFGTPENFCSFAHPEDRYKVGQPDMCNKIELVLSTEWNTRRFGTAELVQTNWDVASLVHSKWNSLTPQRVSGD